MIRRQTAGRVASAIRVCCDGKVFVRRASKTRLAMPVIPSLSEGSRCGNSKLISTRCRDGQRHVLGLFPKLHKSSARHPERKRGTSHELHWSPKLSCVIQSTIRRPLGSARRGMTEWAHRSPINPAVPECARSQRIADAPCHPRSHPCPRAAS